MPAIEFSEAGMTPEEWEQTVPAGVRGDALWKRQDYRLASFLADTAWSEVDALAMNARTSDVAGQLYRALGSIAANIAEGYSRGTSADRVRFLEYALGSARESREWYRRAQPVLGATRVAERAELLTSVIRLLLVIIPSERNDRGARFTHARRRAFEP
jgi:four helix bundle protein